MLKQFTIWLLDKDEHKQLITTDKAINLITDLVIKYFWYGTIYNANGIYTHDDGTLVIEPSVKVEILTDKQHLQFVQEIKTTLNQESVMYQEMQVKTEFL